MLLLSFFPFPGGGVSQVKSCCRCMEPAASESGGKNSLPGVLSEASSSPLQRAKLRNCLSLQKAWMQRKGGSPKRPAFAPVANCIKARRFFSDERNGRGDWTLGCFRAADARRIGGIDGEDDGCCDICFNRSDDSASSSLEFGAFALAVPLERDVAQWQGVGWRAATAVVARSALLSFEAHSCSTGRGCSRVRGTEAAQ